MRENSYNDIRKDEVKRSEEKQEANDIRSDSPSERRKIQGENEQDKFDEYDPWS